MAAPTGILSLEPMPYIQQIRLNDNEQPSQNSRIPTSQTCMNLLKLPNYKDLNILKDKLLASIESGAGFKLTVYNGQIEGLCSQFNHN